MSATRSPLSWPTSWPRTKVEDRKRARFSSAKKNYKADGTLWYVGRGELSVAEATRRLTLEVDRLGAGNMLLSTNLVLRLDGMPRSDRRDPSDPGAAVYFDLAGSPTVLACDRWDRVADNIAALALHVDAMRGMDRWGVGSLAQAFAGYTALPPKGGETDWRVVLGFEAGASVTLELVETRYRELARRHHPDAGGDPEMMSRLNQARDIARRVLAS